MLRQIASRGSVTCSFAPRDSVPGTRAGGQNHFRIPVAGAFLSSLLANRLRAGTVRGDEHCVRVCSGRAMKIADAFRSCQTVSESIGTRSQLLAHVSGEQTACFVISSSTCWR